MDATVETLERFVEVYANALKHGESEIDFQTFFAASKFEGHDPKIGMPSELFNSVSYQVGYNRYNYYVPRIDFKLDTSLLVAAAISSETFGEINMFLTFCVLRGHANLTSLVTKDLAMGWPSKQQLVSAWEAQKICGNNAIDNLRAVNALRQKHCSED